MYRAQCVSLGGKICIFLTPNLNQQYFVILCDGSSTPIINLPPSDNCAVTTYGSKLVLIGGKERSTGRITKKVWTATDNGIFDWQPSLHIPPLPTARVGSSAATGNSDYPMIVVSGGTGPSYRDFRTVEILIEEQWSSVVVPCPIAMSIFHGGKLYLSAKFKRAIYHCDLKTVKDSCTQVRYSYPQLNTLQIPQDHSVNLQCCLASLGQHLVCLHSNIIFAYSPVTLFWVPIGDIPGDLVTVRSFAFVNGDLLVTGFRDRPRFGTIVYRVSILGKECVYVQCHNYTDCLFYVIQRPPMIHMVHSV